MTPPTTTAPGRAVRSATAPQTLAWTTVCREDQIMVDAGVAALVGDLQVAVFRLADGSLHAIDNRDPCSGANVLSRGIVGDDHGRPYVASPVHKERFDLIDGSCLDAPEHTVRVHQVRCVAGCVEVAATREVVLEDAHDPHGA